MDQTHPWYIISYKFRHVARSTRFIRSRVDSSLDTIIRIEAVFKSLAMLVCSMLGEHFTVSCALEGLETCLALDRKGGGVLFEIRISTL